MSAHAVASQQKQQQQQQSFASQSPLIESREQGEVIPQSTLNGASVAARPPRAVKPWADFVAGATGGMVSAVVTAPLDVLKTRLQSDFYQAHLAATRRVPIESLSATRAALLHIKETFQILVAVPRVEGPRALFKGLGPNLIGVVPARATNFFTYGYSKRWLAHKYNNGKETPWVHLLAAVNAGIVTGTVTCPIWVVKTRLQLDRNTAERSGTQAVRRYKNALDCTLQTLRQEGIPGLYRGLGASYLGVTESTLQWVLYEQLKKWLRDRRELAIRSGRQWTSTDETIDSVGKAGGAGLAKTFAALVTYPHEVVRTRLRQAPSQNGQLKYTGIVQCVRLMLKEEGAGALYSGLVPHMLRVVPSAIIMFGVYEQVLKLLGSHSEV